ncbi:5'-nucleotidase [Pseudokineococcus lusitanus]|uniref:5'-nucleotidase n=1 Tax=Pseudokineococcus lusitanus TaxID=763993 RepID=A0A3N1HT29_9ACTN|nr:5'-nucleotidase [Pseudokineococcus lusitanus]ROP45546.1 5'-nucleotidase [Pseudokineococcus lusitanus]
MAAYQLEQRLVVGIASSALFDLAESDAVFRAEGEAAYRKYQEAHLEDTLAPGAAFAFIERLLSLNDLADEGDPLVEVIVMSSNDPDTGLRVMKSIAAHGLPITRAVFRQGRSPHKFMPAFNMSLFLSGDEGAVREAVEAGRPAGRVLPSRVTASDAGSGDLRIAFDFDGVVADDSSEAVMQRAGLAEFHRHEVANVATPLGDGPLKAFLAAINRIQDREEAKRLEDPSYRIRVHVAIVTARNAPSHERALASLKQWGVRVNDAFFLGGIAKSRVLEILRPHIFFDDQMSHLEGAADVVASVHVPFGVVNTQAETSTAPGSAPLMEEVGSVDSGATP